MSFDETPESFLHPQKKRYAEEDLSPTTARELNGWYSYAIAAEVFAVVGVGLFLPVTLEQLPRERGVLFSDRSKPCVAPPAGSGHAGAAPHSIRARDGKEDQCVVKFVGAEVTTTSFAMYTTSAAVLVQALTLICFSSFADHGPYRKKMLLTFAYTGSVVSMLFMLISPSVYFLAPFLVIIGVTCMGCSFTLLNAFLPLLVANHPGSTSATSPHISSSTEDPLDYELELIHSDSETFITRPSADTLTNNFRQSGETATLTGDEDKLTQDLNRSAKISSKGVGLGYAAAVCFQIFSVLLLLLFSKVGITKSSPTLGMRIILFLVGIWWASFSIPTSLWLRPRPGPPLPSSFDSKPTSSKNGKGGNNFIFYALFSIKAFWRTLKRATRLRQVLIFLMAWFLLSDAVATISGTAVLFARTELHMSTIPVVFLSLTSISFGMIGAFAWPRVAAHYALSPKTVLMLCVLAMEIIPLYGLIGFIPFIKNVGVGGMQQAWEIYPVGVLHGLVMGGISSYARSVYGPLIPEGSEAAFFALYAVTDKGSSAFGPALVGWIVNRAGTIRPSFAFLAVLVLLPLPLLWWLDVERGREDAGRMVEGEEIGKYVAVNDGGIEEEIWDEGDEEGAWR